MEVETKKPSEIYYKKILSPVQLKKYWNLSLFNWKQFDIKSPKVESGKSQVVS